MALGRPLLPSPVMARQSFLPCVPFNPSPHLLLTRRLYTGGADTLVRIWDPELGEDQEPPSAAEATDEVTALAAGVCRLSLRHGLNAHRFCLSAQLLAIR